VVGRSSSCAIVLDDHAVSRQHARCYCRSGLWHIEDLGSSNGILVDGVRVDRAVLEPLHEVRIGDTLFKFVDGHAERYARYRIDGTTVGDATVPALPALRELVGGFLVRSLADELARLGPTSLSCVLLGETGTGKEVVAHLLHRFSGRTGELRAVHCGAIPQNLLESELFGVRKGAYTGADRDRQGLVQQAHKGTLFLDEIGEMTPEAQVKLLRVLQSREVVPVGGTDAVKVDIRVVCATHRDLLRAVQEGRFRGDLFARINEHTTTLPPLRERKEDLYALTQAFLARHAPQRLEPSFAFMMAVCQYDWPFNVRELESVVKRAAALAEEGVLEPKHLPAAVLEAYAGSDMGQRSGERTSKVPPAEAPTRAAPEPPPDGDFLRGAPTESTLRTLLARHGGNVASVGRELSKGRMQVHRWMRRYGIVADSYRPR